MLGAKVMGDAQGQDEMDVVLQRGLRTVVIEAKAVAKQGAGPDVQKRAHKVRRFFGRGARAICVVPAWGREAPTGVKDVTGNDVELIGSDLAALRQAVVNALALDHP